MAVELRAFCWNPLLLDEGVQMRFQLPTGVRSHAAADADGKMIGAGERPQVALEVGQEFYRDGVGGLRHEVALGHLQFIALQRARLRQQVIARARRKNEKIGFAPFALDAIPWFA